MRGHRPSLCFIQLLGISGALRLTRIGRECIVVGYT